MPKSDFGAGLVFDDKPSFAALPNSDAEGGRGGRRNIFPL